MAGTTEKNAMFFEVRDAPYLNAENHITKASPEELASRYEPMNQTVLFFAAARPVGQDAQALALCAMLLARGIPVNHADVNGHTALFYAAFKGHVQTMDYLIAKGADPNCVDKNGKTARSWANRQNRLGRMNALNKDEKDQKKRCRSPDGGPVRKRQRVDSEAETHLKKLRAWANEWPTQERVVGKTFKYKVQDVINYNKDFVVVEKAPAYIAARLRVSEKDFVVDHAQLFKDKTWFKHLSPQDWCSKVAVLQDNGGPAAVNAIKAVLAGDDPLHFTLPLVEVKTRRIAGYVHAAYKPETEELNIGHLKVDEAFRGQGLGGLLIEAAEEVSQRLGWNCRTTTLSVLEVNAPARRCYRKAGFKVQSRTVAYWGLPKQHEGLVWLNMSKVHKHHQPVTVEQ